MTANPDQHLESIGLAGDGDEVDAILGVEKYFGVDLDYGDAPNWRTAGDVFGSLLRALPAERRQEEELWPAFASIICEENGADASRVGPDTLLLGLPLQGAVSRWLKRLFGADG